MENLADPTARAWFPGHTFRGEAPGAQELYDKQNRAGMTAAVCLPARDEEATIGTICRAVRQELMEKVPVVDELVVIDSRSTDRTAEVAAAEGAVVRHVDELTFAETGLEDGGKGEALWKSLGVLTSDIVVWVDADTRNFEIGFVTRLLDPLVTDPDLVLAKAFYHRPLAVGDEILGTGGARVTEIATRPLLQLFYPELTGFIQPLSGEFAVRTDAARAVHFMSGYAADVALLINIAERFGLDSMCQVDLGTRVHRNQDIAPLGRMAFQVMQGMLTVLDELGRLKLTEDLPDVLSQFADEGGTPQARNYRLDVVDLPPMDSLEEPPL